MKQIFIRAFVVGDNVKNNMATNKKTEDYGEISAYTYRQLIQTANKRLFNLREKLTKHYEDISGNDYISEILKVNTQTKIPFDESA